MRILQAQIEGTFSVAWQVWSGGIVYLYDGSLKIAGVVHDNEIPIPLNTTATIELTLESCGETVRVRGTGAALGLIGDPKCVEEFRPGTPS